MRRALGLAVVLVAIWLLAWGSLSWANLASGLAVSLGVLVLVPGAQDVDHVPIVRPVGVVRLALRMLWDVTRSNVVLIRQVLSPRPRLNTGVVRVPLAGCSDEVVTIIASLVAMTPGITPVEVVQHPTVMYVHVLDLADPEEIRRSIWSLRDDVLAAFGTRAARAEVAQVKADSLRERR